MRHLTKKYAGEVSFLELTRPEKKNALNREMIEQIIEYLETTANSRQFKVLVISGSNRFLSAGADLGWMRAAADQDETTNKQEADLFTKLYQTLYNYPKPVIVCAEGGAFGGAIGLMACADIVTTTSQATFAFSETKVGLIPATVAPWVIRKTGMAFARKAFLTALPFDGDEALQNNLAQYVFPPDKIKPKTREIAAQIARNAPAAIEETKKLLNRMDGEIVKIDEELTDYCSTKIAEARASSEGQEGVDAFFSKRKPDWS